MNGRIAKVIRSIAKYRTHDERTYRVIEHRKIVEINLGPVKTIKVPQMHEEIVSTGARAQYQLVKKYYYLMKRGGLSHDAIRTTLGNMQVK